MELPRSCAACMQTDLDKHGLCCAPGKVRPSLIQRPLYLLQQPRPLSARP